jgi:6-pyruvoyl-tetrahydropterin synthase
VEESFPAAHYTNPLLSPAGTLHGHNWKVKVTVCKEGKSGWVMDAVKLREKLNEIIDPFRFSLIVPETDAKAWLQRGWLDYLVPQVYDCCLASITSV